MPAPAPTTSQLLHWSTLFGLHTSRPGMPPRFVIGVCVLAWLPVVLALLGLDLGLEGAAARIAASQDLPASAVARGIHTLFAWTLACLAGMLATFAIGVARARREEIEPFLLATVLPTVAILDAGQAMLAWLPSADADIRVLHCATLSRLVLLGGLTLGVFLAAQDRPIAVVRRRVAFSALGCALVGLGGLLFLIAGSPPAALFWDGWLLRPFDLPGLVLGLIALLTVFPAFHRVRPTVLNHTLIITAVPLLVSQTVAVFASTHTLTSASMLERSAHLIAYVTLLIGTVLDHLHAQRVRADALLDIETAQLELRKQTQELERVDRELVEQAMHRERVERSLRMLEKAVETMSLGVTITDMDGRIVYANPADARMHGYTVEQLRGRHASIFGAPGSARDERPPTSGEAWTRERINVTQDGRIFPVRLVSDIVRDADNNPLATVTICEDISERKRIRETLERRDRILEAVSLAAATFLTDSSWESSVGQVLQRLGEATGVDRADLRGMSDGADAPLPTPYSWISTNSALQRTRTGDAPA
ncbi:MAG: PAS domain S-box protein, partial [Acidobacteriota bacterium]